MPATAGRVRMPANNRVHSSAALQTHGIWQSAIGYDPYAPTAAAVNTAAASKPSDRPSDLSHAESERGSAENAYASFQGLLALAKITTGVGASADDVRGACKKCHRVGHLSFQCRNFLSTKDNDDPTALEAAAAAFNKIKKKDLLSEEDDDDESDSTDSDADPDIERILASRLGKKSAKGKNGVDRGEGDRRGRSKSRKSKRSRSSSSSDDEDDEEEDKKRREKRRHRHRSEGSDDDGGEDRRRHKHHRSRKEKKKRRSHRRSSDDDDESGEEAKRHRHHKHRNRGSGSDEDRERSGRKKRRSESEKRSRSSKHKHKH